VTLPATKLVRGYLVTKKVKKDMAMNDESRKDEKDVILTILKYIHVISLESLNKRRNPSFWTASPRTKLKQVTPRM
jgi:hypothetical protein